jgi:hypothetical protein
MAKKIINVLSKGLIRRQSDALVTPSDVADNDNALIPSALEDGAFEAANAIMVGTAGNVTVRLLRKTPAGGDIDSPVPALQPGIQYNVEAFKQVMTTGTSATNIWVGVTSWQYNPGVPGA